MTEDFGLTLIHMDPAHPSNTLRTSISYGMKRPTSVPWPAGLCPISVIPASPPKEMDPLPQADALVVTWTSGEARTMAQLLTGDNFDSWYEYRCDVDKFIPLVTGGRAPFNDTLRSEERYRHSLGLWTPCSIGGTANDRSGVSCVLFKSGLHPAYDGPDVPMVELWKQIIAQVRPKVVITTGTGGGIGADVALGDVIVARSARFDWVSPSLRGKPYAQQSFDCSPIDAEQAKTLITTEMLAPNARLLPAGASGGPRIFWQDDKSTCVSTDEFAFDETTNHYGLEALGRVCDMGDATLGLAISQITDPPAWVSVRNASDPQIKNDGGSDGLANAKKQAEQIYSEYQCITTAGSVITSWAIVVATVGDSVSYVDPARGADR